MSDDAKLSVTLANCEYNHMDLITLIGKVGTKCSQMGAALSSLLCILPLIPPPSGHGFFPPSLSSRLLVSSFHPLSSYRHD